MQIHITSTYIGILDGAPDGFMREDEGQDGDIYPDGPLPPANLHKSNTTKHIRVSYQKGNLLFVECIQLVK